MNMPMNITLKNIPDPIYRRIKAAAERNRRSLNSEIIACLEHQLAPTAVDVSERLRRVARLRAMVGEPISVEEIDEAIDRGRS